MLWRRPGAAKQNFFKKRDEIYFHPFLLDWPSDLLWLIEYRRGDVWFPSLGPKTALQLLPWLFEALILWEASHSVGGTTQKAHVKRSTWRALRRATKNWHQLARHVHAPLWKCTFQPYLSLQMICATLEVHLPAPLKPSDDCSPADILTAIL